MLGLGSLTVYPINHLGNEKYWVFCQNTQTINWVYCQTTQTLTWVFANLRLPKVSIG